jgi:hypothetical protein
VTTLEGSSDIPAEELEEGARARSAGEKEKELGRTWGRRVMASLLFLFV